MTLTLRAAAAPETPAEWAARISDAWRSGVEAILETGRLMAAARDAHPGRAEWNEVLGGLPFGARHAQMLIRIGSDPRLTRHVSSLPSDIKTLDALVAIPDVRFDPMIADGTIHPAMNRNALATLVKAERRAARERDLAAGTRAAAAALAAGDSRGRYNVGYADPPWRFEAYHEVTGGNKAPDNHYPTMTTDEIRALPAGDLFAGDAVLFLWATVPMLPDALQVLAAWGFAYKSQFVWVKDRFTNGFWSRVQHELLLVGTRGGIPAPAPGSQVSSVLRTGAGERLAHSQKPAGARDMIEAYFPNLPRVELFARVGGAHPAIAPGWDAWGNEAAP